MHEDAVRGACLHCERVHYQPWTKPITRDSPEAEEVSGIRNKFRSDEDKRSRRLTKIITMIWDQVITYRHVLVFCRKGVSLLSSIW